MAYDPYTGISDASGVPPYYNPYTNYDAYNHSQKQPGQQAGQTQVPGKDTSITPSSQNTSPAGSDPRYNIFPAGGNTYATSSYESEGNAPLSPDDSGQGTGGGSAGGGTQPGGGGSNPHAANAKSSIAQFYSEYLGRSASADEIDNWYNHIANGMNLEWVRQQIYNSSEAIAYRSKTAAEPPAATKPAAGGGAPKVGGGGGSNYTPPGVIPSPFINPDGSIPLGLPFQPDAALTASQNKILDHIMTTDVLSPQHISMVNEQQKELALQRGEANRRALLQNAASRSTLGGGTFQGQTRRMHDAITSQLLQSNRDIALQANEVNRSGKERALGISEEIAGGRETRSLNVGKFVEAIRQYNNDLLNRQSEFGAGLNFNYDQLNAMLEQFYIQYILNGGK